MSLKNVEYRIVEQDRNAKVLKRTDVWVETRDPKRGALDASRTIQMYGTDESVDRHNTKLRVDGWDFSDYRKNPTFLWAHNNDLAVPMMPIGSVVRIQREEFERASESGAPKTDKRLLFDIEFPQRGTYPFADLVCDMYQQGHLRASSVGFKNIEMRRLNADKDEDEMKAEGYDLKAGFAADLTKNALLELSAVPVGSNPNALQKALHAAAPEAVRGIVEYLPDSGIDLDEEWVTKRLEALRVALCTPDDETLSGVDDPKEPTRSAQRDELDLEIEAATRELEGALNDEHDDPATRFVKKVGNKYCVFSKAGKQLACHPTKEEADKQLGAIEAAKADEAKKGKSVPVFPDPLSGTPATQLETLTKEFKTALDALRDEIHGLRDELKQVRAAVIETPAVSPITDPAPSHLDLIIAENLESFERLEKLLVK